MRRGLCAGAAGAGDDLHLQPGRGRREEQEGGPRHLRGQGRGGRRPRHHQDIRQAQAESPEVKYFLTTETGDTEYLQEPAPDWVPPLRVYRLQLLHPRRGQDGLRV